MSRRSLPKRLGSLLLRLTYIFGLLFVLALLGGIAWEHLGPERVASINDFFQHWALFFFLFRMGLYVLIWTYWQPLTRHYGERNDWDDARIEYMISERGRIMPWFAVLEVAIVGPQLMRFFNP